MLLLLSSLALGADQSVLLIGNSYTFFNELDQSMAAALVDGVPAWDEVYAERLATGGQNFAGHAELLESDPSYAETLEEGWDLVILQEQSQTPGFMGSDGGTYYEPSLEGARALNDAIEAAGAETAFLLTWGRRDGDAQNSTLYPDFTTMQERLTAGYLNFVDELSTPERPVWVVPAGQAWQQVHDGISAEGGDPTEADSDFYALYTEDGSHPSPHGTALISWTAVAAWTGHSPVGLPTPDGVDSELAGRLQQAAHDAVLGDPFGEIPYRWAVQVTEADDFEALEPALQATYGVFGTVSVDGLALSDARVLIGPEGTLELRESAGTGLTLEVDGGRLSAPGAAIDGDVYVLSGVLDLDSLGVLQVSGALELGPDSVLMAYVQGDPGEQITIASAAEIRFDGMADLRGDNYDQVAVTDTDDGQALVVTIATLDDFMDDPDAERSCGCTSRQGSATWPLLGLLLLLGVRRRC